MTQAAKMLSFMLFDALPSQSSASKVHLFKFVDIANEGSDAICLKYRTWPRINYHDITDLKT